MKKGSICIIDDEVDMLETCSDILTAEGYSVETSSESTEGLKLVTENEYDVVVIDLMMQRMGGIEILKQVHEVHPDMADSVID